VTQLPRSICPPSVSLGPLTCADYRWFPTGKIVFLAPTKPLVHQQIEACQMTCGIPSADAAVMTGANVSAKERAKLVSELGAIDGDGD
jgi:ERCC4-related helicase